MLSNDPKLTLSFRYCAPPQGVAKDSFPLKAERSCRLRLLTASSKVVVITMSLLTGRYINDPTIPLPEIGEDPLVFNSRQFSLYPSDDPVTQLAVDFYDTVRTPPEVETTLYHNLKPAVISSRTLNIELEFPIHQSERQPIGQPRRRRPDKVRDISIFSPTVLTTESD